MSFDKFDSVICFGGEDWWYHNQGHFDMQLMGRFARMGTTVYVNSIVMQKPNLQEGKKFLQKVLRKVKSIAKGLQKSNTGFWVYSTFSLPVHHIFWLRPINDILLQLQLQRVIYQLGIRVPIVWVACPAACEVALKMKKIKLVYQRTDNFEEYPNVDANIIRSYDRKLKITADLTIFVSKMLFDTESIQCKNALYLDHGVDYDMFALAEQDLYKPEDITHIPKPIVGFFGNIDDHIFDMPFTEKLIDLMPKMSFVFVGKGLSDMSTLKSRNNVWLLGQKPYEKVPHYGKCFDVAIMPWRQNRWIEACNPIKLKEYLALGKPIVSTPFPELDKYLDLVCIANTPKDFSHCIVKALSENNLQRIEARRKKVQNDTWDRKARIVIKELFRAEVP